MLSVASFLVWAWGNTYVAYNEVIYGFSSGINLLTGRTVLRLSPGGDHACPLAALVIPLSVHQPSMLVRPVRRVVLLSSGTFGRGGSFPVRYADDFSSCTGCI